MGVGPDGAIRVYGRKMQVAASDYFIETGEGLAFSQYDNGTPFSRVKSPTTSTPTSASKSTSCSRMA